ncbi:hypothetical protein Y032_0298g1763 [Ancylostoma ceylanicum]|uniref:Uncharacterized protein n=1 Tax=Ancylostoma ceylanicum TaxID=53326 RepID=A0A016S4N3_9BILA|nr:hypothetical protein Y032_0298g1763 [Ancylostoma ceylanicum]
MWCAEKVVNEKIEEKIKKKRKKDVQAWIMKIPVMYMKCPKVTSELDLLDGVRDSSLEQIYAKTCINDDFINWTRQDVSPDIAAVAGSQHS